MNRYIILFLLMIQNLFSVGITAGTEIKNIAYLNYTLESVDMETKSNELIDIVDQKLDSNMVCQEGGPVIVEPEDSAKVMQFLLLNNGNGAERYSFTHATGSPQNFSVLNPKIYADNGDGIFSISEDKLVNELTLDADEKINLFLVADIPKDAEKFSLNGITSNSLTQGDLAYGESKKLEDFYVVAATTQEAKSALCTYEVPSLVLELEKSVTLSSDKLYKGTTMHYEIGVKAIGIGSVDDVIVEDMIPEGTVYVENSLRLDGKEVGRFNGKGIFVAIGTISQEEESEEIVHRVTFDVKVL